MADGRAALRPLAAAVLAALATAPAALSAPPPPRAAPVWSVDKAASRLSFRAAIGGRPFDGVFKRWDAQLAFDPANLAASRLQLVVETGSALTGDPARDALLPSTAWLAAARFPHATFTSRGFAQEGPARYRVSGVVTLHGTARPLDAVAHIDMARDRLVLTGSVPLDRHAFGIGPPGGDAAAAAVQVQARLAFRRAR